MFKTHSLLSRTAILAAIQFFVIGIICQAALPTGSDVSWLIVVAEKMLDGQRLYVDIIESNPPMAIFIYVPAVLIEHLTGLRAETAEIAVTSIVALGSLLLSAEIMARSPLKQTIGPFIIAGAFALMILPCLTFSEREHFALMLMLPSFTLTATRVSKTQIPLALVMMAGLAAGIGAAIKPHFVVAMLAPALYLVVRTRSLRPILGLDNWIAGGIVIAFAIFVVVAYPAYISSVMPMEVDTYIHLRKPLHDLMLDRLFLAMCGVGLITFVLRRRDVEKPQTIVLLLAASGFAIAYLEQSKGWRYQLYPALALVFIGFGIEIFPQLSSLIFTRDESRFKRYPRIAAVCFAIVGLVQLCLLENYSYTISLPLVPQIKAIAPHARIFALSTDLGVGHPLSRAVDGVWVGSVCSQLITLAAEFRRDLPETDAATRARMEGWINWDRDRIEEAIRRGRPDVIVVDHASYDLNGLVTAREDIRQLLLSYKKTATVDTLDLLVRQDLVLPTVANRALGP